MHRALSLGAALLTVLLAVPLQARCVQAVGTGGSETDRLRDDTTALTLDEARRIALADNLEYLAALQRLAATRGELRTAETWPFNPELGLDGPGALSGGTSGRWEFRLVQEVEWAGQRGLRTRTAEAANEAARASALDDARTLLTGVEHAWVALAAARERLTLAREIETLGIRLADAVRTELSEGEISLLEANLAEIEAARARARVLSVEREVRTAALALGRLLGISPEQAEALDVAREGGLPEAPELGASADGVPSTTRPDLTAARAESDRVASLERLARRSALPNLRVGGIAEGAGASESPRYGISVGLPIPLFDRNQGLRMRRAAEAEAARLEVDAADLRIRTEIRSAVRALDTTRREMEIFRDEILAPARANQELLEIAYREGKVDLGALLLLRNQLLDAELGYWDAWQRNLDAVVTLRSATGSILDDLTTHLPEALR